MCDYCEKHHFLAVETEQNARGIVTQYGVSITGNWISLEKKRYSSGKKARMIEYNLLAHGKIRYCPMCKGELKEA